MTAPTRARALVAALLSCVLLAFTAATALAAEGAAINYVEEPLKTYEQQLSSGQIASVTVNKYIRSLRVTLKNGEHFKTKYKAKQSQAVVEALNAKKVPVTVLSKSQARNEAKGSKGGKKHKWRYIIGAVVIVLLLAIGGFLLYRRRGGGGGFGRGAD